METVCLVYADTYNIEPEVLCVFAVRSAAQAFVDAHPEIKGIWLDPKDWEVIGGVRLHLKRNGS